MVDARWGQWIAGALATFGVAVPLLVAAAPDRLTSQETALWIGIGLLFLFAAFVVWEWSGRTSVRQRLASWEHVIRQMRGTSLQLDQVQRRVGEIDGEVAEIASFRQLLNEERHNLSLVASGMVEIRASIDGEQRNLGALAEAVHEIRTVSEQRDRDINRLTSEVVYFNEMISAQRVHLDALSCNFALLSERAATEQANLGMVAAGLDSVRRASSGIDRFDARQSAFEDALVAIADRIDLLDASTPVRAISA